MRSMAACRCSVVLHRSELTQGVSPSTSSAAALCITDSRGWQRKEETGATDRWCLQRLSWTWGSSNRQRTRDPVLLVLSLHRPQTERYTITLFIFANKINNKVQSDGVMLHCFLGIRFDFFLNPCLFNYRQCTAVGYCAALVWSLQVYMLFFQVNFCEG